MRETVSIMAVGEVPAKYLDVLAQELNKRGYVRRFVVDGKLGFPEGAGFNKYRGQWDAQELLKLASGNAIIVTTQDVYAGQLNYVFGLTKTSGPCIVSLARLDPVFYGKNQNFSVTADRLVKEAIHELGHLIGLRENCVDPECVMTYAQHVTDIDKKSKNFCKTCEIKLTAAGTEL